MKVYSWDDFITLSPLKNVKSAVTIGVFDGIHKGHLSLLRKVSEEKRAEASVVFTFTENPAAVIRKEQFGGNIYTLGQKLAVMEDIGVGFVILIDFSHNFGKLSGRRFFSLIEENLDLVKIVVGYDFKCGYENDTSIEEIINIHKNTGIIVEVMPKLKYDGLPIKSTLIRNLIKTGETGKLAEIMYNGYSIDISGKVPLKTGDQYYIERKYISQLVPGNGIYELKLFDSGKYIDAYVTVDDTAIKWTVHK